MSQCIVTVAQNMSDQTFHYLSEKIRDRFGKDIQIVKLLDNRIIGGFMLDVDGHIFDLTVKTQLIALKKHMNDGGEA